MQAYNVKATDEAKFSDEAWTPQAAALDGGHFDDAAGATRVLVVSSSDSATLSSAGFPQNPSGDSATFTDAASVISDLGRFRRGDWAPLALSVAALPDGPPVAVILDSNSDTIATVMMPASTADGLNFLLSAQISLDYSVGNFSVFYHYTLSGQSTLQQSMLEVIPGGDSGGAVISMYSVDRPEVRSIVAQLDSGVLVLGRSPSVKE